MKRYVVIIALISAVVAAGVATAWCDPIHDAAYAGDLPKVKALLATDPSLVNAKNEEGISPLYAAVWSDHEAVVEFLLSKGADVHFRDEASNEGSTPLHLTAITSEKKKIAELLIAKGADVNAKRKRDNATPLHDAAAHGHAEVVKVLLANKAIVDAKDNGGQTPLYFAAGEGHKEIVELLLAKGADINVTVGKVDTPLLAALLDKNIEVAELLIAKGAKLDIFSATALGKIDQIKRLLKADPALVRATGDDGMTPLHVAVLVGQKNSVETLLANNADVNARDKDGQTPLALAESPFFGEKKDIAELLRRHRTKS